MNATLLNKIILYIQEKGTDLPLGDIVLQLAKILTCLFDILLCKQQRY